MWFIILNPAASNGTTGKKWQLIERELQHRRVPYSVHFTNARGHATQLAQDAILKGYRKILGIGGDGTNHEICNGILSQNWVASSEILYALMPFGTGNDWARQWNISRDITTRIGNLKLEKAAWQDVGHVTYQKDGITRQRFFVNVAGMAFDAHIVQHLENQRVVSRLHYLYMVVRHLFQYRLLPAHIEFDGCHVSDVFYTINVGLCRFSGGGMQFVPQALPDDGLFALTFARKLAKWEVLQQTYRFYNGTILQHPKVEGHSARTIKVWHEATTAPTLLEADGEFLGETPCCFTILEKKLRICL